MWRERGYHLLRVYTHAHTVGLLPPVSDGSSSGYGNPPVPGPEPLVCDPFLCPPLSLAARGHASAQPQTTKVCPQGPLSGGGGKPLAALLRLAVTPCLVLQDWKCVKSAILCGSGGGATSADHTQQLGSVPVDSMVYLLLAKQSGQGVGSVITSHPHTLPPSPLPLFLPRPPSSLPLHRL